MTDTQALALCKPDADSQSCLLKYLLNHWVRLDVELHYRLRKFRLCQIVRSDSSSLRYGHTVVSMYVFKDIKGVVHLRLICLLPSANVP